MRSSFNRRAARMTMALACVAVAAQTAAAQAKSSSAGFGLGYTDVGVVVGLGGVGGASASFGGRFEHAIKALPDLGNGILGIQAAFDYYSWSGPGYSWKYIPIGVTANYHFKLDEPKIDPFVGLGLGYQVITCDAPGLPSGYCSNSAIYFIGRAGARYFFSPSMAAYGDVGAGGATLNLGIMFKLH
jgi:Outer membrane protein beta-barrel domain